MRRRAAAEQQRQQKQTGPGGGAAGTQVPPCPAPSTSALCSQALAAAQVPETAAPRPPSALRGLFATPSSRPAGLPHLQHPQQHAPHWQTPHPAPTKSSFTPQPAPQQQRQLWPAPTSAEASQAPSVRQHPFPPTQQQQLQHPPCTQHPLAYRQQQSLQEACEGRLLQGPSATPHCAQPRPGQASCSQLPPRPGSALAAIFSSGRPRSAGFAFQPPPGLLLSFDPALPVSQVRQHEGMGTVQRLAWLAGMPWPPSCDAASAAMLCVPLHHFPGSHFARHPCCRVRMPPGTRKSTSPLRGPAAMGAASSRPPAKASPPQVLRRAPAVLSA